MVDKMIDDLEGRSRFAHFRKRDFEQAAGIPSKAGFDAWGRVRESLWGLGGNIMGRFPPCGAQSKPTQFTERNLQSM